MAHTEDSEVQRLRFKLKEAEEALQKAGQYGLQLLDDQMNLQNKLEEQRIEMTNTVEVLEQEKYSLQREVELKARLLDSLRSELDAVKSQQKQQLEQQHTLLERNHALEFSDLKNKMEKLKAERDEAQLLDKQLRHKLELQSEVLSSKTEELRVLNERAQETMSSEILELQVQRMELESSVARLEQEMQEVCFREQQLQLSSSTLKRQLEQCTEEKEERERETVSCYNALEKAREANQDLQIQLDQVLQQAQDPNSKGNSLFAEVEDKRAEMERQMIGMKVQYQSLQKQHIFSKQQMHRMKVQIATLLQLQGSRADPAQLQRLQAMLSDKNSEIEELMVKVRQLEKVEMSAKDHYSNGPASEHKYEDTTYYTDLLKLQLSKSKKEVEQLKDELSLQRMKSLAESQRVLEMERKLFEAECALKQSQSHYCTLQIKLEELRMKYEPNEVSKTRVQKRRREKLPVDVPKDCLEQVKEEANPVDLEVARSLEENADAENLPCNAEKPTVERPADMKHPHQVKAEPASSPPQPRGSKCVRISTEPPVPIPDPPRSPVENYNHKIEQPAITKEEEETVVEENRKMERRKKNKAHMAIHVVPGNTMENQCAQQ